MRLNGNTLAETAGIRWSLSYCGWPSRKEIRNLSKFSFCHCDLPAGRQAGPSEAIFLIVTGNGIATSLPAYRREGLLAMTAHGSGKELSELIDRSRKSVRKKRERQG